MAVPIVPEPDDPLPVLEDMTDMADDALAQEAASVPPEAPQIELPETEPPPQQDMLSEMGEVTKAEAGLFHEQKPPKQTARQKRHQGPPPEQPQNPFPFRAVPPAPTADIMREMGEVAKEGASFAGKSPTAAGIPTDDLERLTFPGDEQADNLVRRYTEHIDGTKRYQASLIQCLMQLTQTVVEHERALHEIRGLLERSRT